MSTDAPTMSDAKQWCIEARKVLKLSRKEKSKLDLKKRSTAAVDNLNKLNGKVPQEVYDRMKKELLEISGRVHGLSSGDDRSLIDIESQRLNALACTAKQLAKGDKSSEKDLTKSLSGLALSLINSVTGASPEARGEALAQKLLQLAESGVAVNNDVKALSLVASNEDATPEQKKIAASACKKMVALHQQKAKGLGASDNERDVKRVPSDVMVNLLAVLRAELKKNPSEELKKLERQVNMQIMKHQLTVADTKKFLAEAAKICESVKNDKLKNLCGTLTKEMHDKDEDVAPTQLQENIYGRVFDSALVGNLIQNPPESVKKAQTETGKGFGKFLATVKPELLKASVKDIQKYLKGEGETEDTRFWVERVPGLLALRDAEDDDALDRLNDFLAADKTNGDECMAVPWLLVKMSLALKEKAGQFDVMPDSMTQEQISDWHKNKGARLFAGAPWMKKANENYQEISKHKSNVKPGERGGKFEVTSNKTEGSGITLQHQPNANENEGYTTKSTRPANINLPGFKRQETPGKDGGKPTSTGEVEGMNTDAMKTALEHGLPYASGASGSTNIMLHLMEYMNAQGHAKIDPKDALLGTTMFLIGDGGHSLQEVLLTANAMDGKLGLGMGFEGGKNEEFVGDYDKFIRLYGDSESGKALQQASDGAMNRVAEYFEENSHYSEQNKGDAQKVSSDWSSGKPKTGDTSTAPKSGGTSTVPKSGEKSDTTGPKTTPTGKTESSPPKRTPPKTPPKPVKTSPPPDEAPLVIGDVSSSNPTLYFLPNSKGGKNFFVGSSHPGGDWTKVEQFCAYLAAHWLAAGKTGGLKFADLGSSQQDAVDTLISWGSSGGLAAQESHAQAKIGGHKMDKGEITRLATNNQLKAGMKIWFGTNVHSRAAMVTKMRTVVVYDPTDGKTKTMTGPEFASAISGDSAFVVSGD